MELVRRSLQDLLQENRRNPNTHLTAALPPHCQHTWPETHTHTLIFLDTTAVHNRASVLPVVAAYGRVWQAGVTRHVDAIGISVQFSSTEAAASVGDVIIQYRHNTVQWRGVVKHCPWCILGSQKVLEVKGSDLDSELYSAYD